MGKGKAAGATVPPAQAPGPPKRRTIRKPETVAGKAPPALGAWPQSDGKDVKFHEAPEVDHLIRVCLDDHEDLVNVRFRAAFQKDPSTTKGKAQVGKVVKLSPLMVHLFTADVVLVVAWEAWKNMAPKMKKALVDFLLCHLWREAETGTLKEKGPDFLGFHQNVEKYGAWEGDVKKLIQTAHQMDFLEDQGLGLVSTTAADDQEAATAGA